MADLRRRGLATLAFLTLALGAATGCGASAAEEQPAASTVSIAQALAAEPGTKLTVRGAVHVDSGHTRLCSRLAESFPPQCGGKSLRIHGLAYDSVPGIQTSPDESVHWAEGVTVSGRIEPGGALRIE